MKKSRPMQRDRKYLKLFAAAVHKELKRRHLGRPFRAAHHVKVATTGTNGWSAKVGTFSGYRTSANVWIDRFTAHTQRKVYYTLFSPNPTDLAALTKNAGRELGKHLTISGRDWDQKCRYTRLDRPLAKARFGRPVYERYRGIGEYYYGVYELDHTGLQKNEFNRLVERAVEFFQTLVVSVSSGSDQNNREDYPGVENRKSVTRHIRRERKSHLATLRKQQDNYICRVCDFDFSKTYGQLGNDFAETHHIVPLSANNKIRQTTIEDLATVCANCHRMLHRMKGERSDVAALRRLLRKNGFLHKYPRLNNSK